LIGPFLTWYLALVGLMLGSFINLVADRLPRGESIVTPRSHCRACGRQLNTVDLLPVVGYLVRGGRCASCASPIGIAAPIVEATCGACVVTGIAWQGLWPGALLGMALVAIVGASVIGLAMRRPRVPPERSEAA
jgi:prepilin signal peptidase PulO-like enzyme (type II secretory pathway)